MKSKIMAFLFVVGAFLTTSVMAQNESKIFNVNVEQFEKLVNSEKGVVLDVRTPEEWAEGTIPKAEKIDYWGENFVNELEVLDKNVPVFVYCKRGGRSASAAEVLKEKGFTKIFNLEGGFLAWKEAGNKIE